MDWLAIPLFVIGAGCLGRWLARSNRRTAQRLVQQIIEAKD
jgi:hypothetical protein